MSIIKDALLKEIDREVVKLQREIVLLKEMRISIVKNSKKK